MTARYVIGIDLGTTNSVIAYADLEAEEPCVKLLPIPQLVAPGTTEAQRSLPSFLYLATEAESQGGTFDVPWQDHRSFCVGQYASRQSAEVPDRTVGGAKSWLGHHKIDRHQPILPWDSPADLEKISPVVASQRYLEHLIAAWHHEFPDAPLQQQRVVLTVPASFDESARELTREAALAAGLPADMILLEEPQAAVYAWLDQLGDRWRKVLGLGDTLLVCDVGGGTTDLTLVQVEESSGELVLSRRAVGNHLLVGGDNMDLALAYRIAERFEAEGVSLDPWQSISLWHSCRSAKERLLSSDGPDSLPITVTKKGSKLIGGSVSVELDRNLVAETLIEGFFPRCESHDRPEANLVSGFQEIGLPYEADTAVTRHVASFLALHGGDGSPVAPTHILFNGGVFKADALKSRLLEVISSWSPEQPLLTLDGEHDLDFAVSKGAAYYGWSKQRGGIRIRGGTARSYYVGIETAGLAVPGAPRPLRALCVVPFGMEEGTEVDVPSNDIGLVVGQQAKFRFFESAVRKEDHVGDLIGRWSSEEIAETDPLETTLPKDDAVDEPFLPVRFQSRVTELGIFELWCVSTKSDQKWKLEFSVRQDD